MAEREATRIGAAPMDAASVGAFDGSTMFAVTFAVSCKLISFVRSL